jgi:cytidyltransferase-like protein
MKYTYIVTGGTFDHFHIGHQNFLRYAFSISEQVLIGLTTDLYAQQKRKDDFVESYTIREQALLQFFAKEKLEDRAKIAPIDSVFIPEVWQTLPIEAVLVTEDSKSGGEAINKKRAEQSKDSLIIETFPMVLADDSVSISSTRIRKGSINRKGESYIKKELFENTSLLPKNVRNMLKKPFGEVTAYEYIDFTGISMNEVITVGDVTTSIFLKNKKFPKIAIIDFFVERNRKYSSFTELGFKGSEKIYYSANPAGQLTPSLFLALQQIFSENRENSILFIDGEEDLSVLTALLYAPLNFHIFYGQPGEGLVHIRVTEDIKEKAREIISAFNKNLL